MYGQLRTRQAINKFSIINPHQQCFFTVRSLSLLSHEWTRTSRPLLSRKAEQRRQYGLKRGKGFFCPSDREAPTGLRKWQNINWKAFTYSHPLCAIEAYEIAKPFSASDVPVDMNNSDTKQIPIRDRLRLWESTHQNQAIKSVMADVSIPGGVRNSRVGGEDEEDIVDPFPVEGNFDRTLFFEREELTEIGNNRPFLLKGDMVEMILSGRRKPELALFVRQSHAFAQFYTMSGKLVTRNVKSILFSVPNFVNPGELDGLIPYLPEVDSLGEDKLKNFDNAPPRKVGGPLVLKLLEFWKQTEKTFRKYADVLDNAHEAVASKRVLAYYTLEEVADKLLPKSEKQSGQYPAWVLYAVHRALMEDSTGFRPRRGGTHRLGSQYEVSPKIDCSIINKVTNHVRMFQEAQVSATGPIELLPLQTFVKKAQFFIDESRKHRQLTTAGTLGPYQNLKMRPAKKEHEFKSTDFEFIRFIESWAAMLSFSPDSPSNGIGSFILRATKRYDGLELDKTLAWTFLQEIGALAPWDNKVAFDLRLPDAGLQLRAEEEYRLKGPNVPLTDRMKSLRIDWTSPVYCIDDAGAHEIDDGVSLDPVKDSPGEYWVHIHTADPASHIDPSSHIAENARHLASSVYLPERLVSMIPRDITLRLFSLSNNQPSLTFSARMDKDGEILDTKITPGYVRNVKHITPPVVEEVISGKSPFETCDKVYAVGDLVRSERSDSGRVYLQGSELTDDDKQTLRMLHALGHARRKRAIERGALPAKAQACLLSQQGPSISIDLNFRTNSQIPFHYACDPRIELRTRAYTPMTENAEREQTTTNLMLLGGEIVAKWCHDRGIPIIYRVTPQNPDRPDQAKYMRDILLPALERQDVDRVERVHEYLGIIGQIQPSSIPGPHLGIGVSKFSKCTSPLRRYGDLLVHWQVEAALREEARTGKSLVGSTREDYLPFPKRALDAMLPVIDGRERLVKNVQRDAIDRWICQFILRAWQFKQCELPKSFSCEVRKCTSVAGGRPVVHVVIKFLGVEAEFDLPSWLTASQVMVGDLFDCEFEGVNVYRKKISLKPLGKTGSIETRSS